MPGQPHPDIQPRKPPRPVNDPILPIWDSDPGSSFDLKLGYSFNNRLVVGLPLNTLFSTPWEEYL